MKGLSRRIARSTPRLVLLAALGLVLGAAPPSAAASADVLEATLGNGLRVVIVRNTIAPVVATDMTYLVGSRDDAPDFPGLAHAQEHMMFRGTPSLSTSELGTVATALGGSFNAATSDELTQYQFTVPAVDLDAVLRIEADRMHNALDAQAQWQNERGAIEQEVLRDESEPGADFFAQAQAIAFAGTAYAHPGVGTKAAFERLTGPRLKAFYDRWYAPNNAVLVIAGDVDPARALAEVRARFDDVPRHPVPAHATAHFAPLHRTLIRHTSTLVYPLASIGYRLPGIDSPDFLPAFVLQGILDSDRSSIHALVDSGDALEAQWISQPYFDEGQLAFASAALGPQGSPARAVGKLQQAVDAYARHGVPSDLFESTKRRLITGQEESRNSIAALASDWATTIALDREPSIAHEQKLIADVTLAQVDSVARRYLRADRAIVGELTPSAQASQNRAPQAATTGPEKPLTAQPPVTHLPSWATQLVEHVAVAPSAVHPVRYTLPNGIDLIVQPETISNSVFVFGNVRTQPVVQEPEGQSGISSVLAGIFDSGTATLDRVAFARAQDDLDAQITTGTSFGIQSTPATFDRALALLATAELHPRFDTATFATAQRRAAEQLQTALNGSAATAAERAASYLLPSGDPEQREPTVHDITSLSLGDVEAFDRSIMRPDLTTIVVVGKVDPAEVREQIARAFGAWQADGPRPDLTLPALPLNPPGTVNLTLPIGQDAVTFEQIVGVRRSTPEQYALQVGNTILGGGALGPEQSRLFRDLRQNAGLVYSIGSQLEPRRKRYEFTLDFACSPPNQQRIVSLIEDEIHRMQTQPVGAFELALAKASIVRQTLIGQASIGAIGGELLGEAIDGQPFDAPENDARHVVETDAVGIEAAFAAAIHPDHFVRIIEGP